MDFLKAHPNVTREEYMWEWSVPQIMLASADLHTLYILRGRRSARARKAERRHAHLLVHPSHTAVRQTSRQTSDSRYSTVTRNN